MVSDELINSIEKIRKNAETTEEVQTAIQNFAKANPRVWLKYPLPNLEGNPHYDAEGRAEWCNRKVAEFSRLQPETYTLLHFEFRANEDETISIRYNPQS